MSSHTMSNSTNTASSLSLSNSDIAHTEQWSEASSPCDSAYPSRTSMSDDMPDDQAITLANLFLDNHFNVATTSWKSADGSTAISRANCGPLKMPKNFAQVLPGIYRSHYPTTENFTFMRVLGIRTILTLVPEDCPDSYNNFMSQFGIQHFQVPIVANKDPAVTINPASMEAALRVLATASKQPVLVHCNKGKHRTGCVVACLRKIMGWNHQQVLAEYRHHAAHKARILDERYIEAFDPRPFQDLLRQGCLRMPDMPARSIVEPYAEGPASNKAVAVSRLRG